MHPFARALGDFHSGNPEAAFTIRRDDGFQQRVPAAAFFDVSHYPGLEIRAMDECRGSVLDIGSAAGRHSLELVRRGLKVTSLDILPEMKPIMEQRGLTDVVIADIFQFEERRYDTLLMLMNGIGMAGSLDGLAYLLQRAHDLVFPGGQILCDSIDVNVTTHPQHVAYREKNVAEGRSAGQQAFVMEHEAEDAVHFEWLHIDFRSLSQVCGATGWDAELLESENDGHYLCRLIEKSEISH
ncbi:MAG: class I SAM-dependent methyltransferase [Prosthecobacter sp.]